MRYCFVTACPVSRALNWPVHVNSAVGSIPCEMNVHERFCYTNRHIFFFSGKSQFVQRRRVFYLDACLVTTCAAERIEKKIKIATQTSTHISPLSISRGRRTVNGRSKKVWTQETRLTVRCCCHVSVGNKKEQAGHGASGREAKTTVPRHKSINKHNNNVFFANVPAKKGRDCPSTRSLPAIQEVQYQPIMPLQELAPLLLVRERRRPPSSIPQALNQSDW